MPDLPVTEDAQTIRDILVDLGWVMNKIIPDSDEVGSFIYYIEPNDRRIIGRIVFHTESTINIAIPQLTNFQVSYTLQTFEILEEEVTIYSGLIRTIST